MTFTEPLTILSSLNSGLEMQNHVGALLDNIIIQAHYLNLGDEEPALCCRGKTTTPPLTKEVT